MSKTRRTVAALVVLFAVFALLPADEATAADCRDQVVGLGWIDSPSGRGSAGFAFAAGYFEGATSPSVNFYYADPGSKVLLTALTIDRYGGFGPTDRLWGGTAWVKVGKASGVTGYAVEVLDFGTPGGGVDYFYALQFLKPDGSGQYYQVLAAILEGGDVRVLNRDTITPGC